MTAPDPDARRRIAGECVTLVAADFGRRMDWSLGSLAELDLVCASLLAEGPLEEQRLELWWKVIRAYGGTWSAHEQAAGAFAVSALGVTAFPFALASRVLSGEPFKSLASFGRAFPAVGERARHPS